jgi:glycosyltransferase involved in cell wall biosynthesis
MIRVNVYAQNGGWLFEDLKQHFARRHVAGIQVLASDEPLITADAWVVIRTHEAEASPDLKRTVVCIHDLYDHSGMYRPGGMRQAVRHAGALALSHPDQRRILRASDVSLEGLRLLERPLGALSIFQVRQRPPQRFCVGWVGRNHWRKRPEWFVEAVQGLGLSPAQLRAVMIGLDLGQFVRHLQVSGVDCRYYPRETHSIGEYPRLYQELDCVVITSCTEAGPLPLFEALATGLPVISTPVGWAPMLAEKAPQFVRLASDPAQITARLNQLRAEKQTMFEKRCEMAGVVAEWTLDAWLVEVLRLAASLVRT